MTPGFVTLVSADHGREQRTGGRNYAACIPFWPLSDDSDRGKSATLFHTLSRLPFGIASPESWATCRYVYAHRGRGSTGISPIEIALVAGRAIAEQAAVEQATPLLMERRGAVRPTFGRDRDAQNVAVDIGRVIG